MDGMGDMIVIPYLTYLPNLPYIPFVLGIRIRIESKLQSDTHMNGNIGKRLRLLTTTNGLISVCMYVCKYVCKYVERGKEIKSNQI